LVVTHEVELRLAALGEHHLGRTGDADGAAGQLHVDVIAARHRCTVAGAPRRPVLALSGCVYGDLTTPKRERVATSLSLAHTSWQGVAGDVPPVHENAEDEEWSSPSSVGCPPSPVTQAVTSNRSSCTRTSTSSPKCSPTSIPCGSPTTSTA